MNPGSISKGAAGDSFLDTPLNKFISGNEAEILGAHPGAGSDRVALMLVSSRAIALESRHSNMALNDANVYIYDEWIFEVGLDAGLENDLVLNYMSEKQRGEFMASMGDIPGAMGEMALVASSEVNGTSRAAREMVDRLRGGGTVPRNGSASANGDTTVRDLMARNDRNKIADTLDAALDMFARSSDLFNWEWSEP